MSVVWCGPYELYYSVSVHRERERGEREQEREREDPESGSSSVGYTATSGLGTEGIIVQVSNQYTFITYFGHLKICSRGSVD